MKTPPPTSLGPFWAATIVAALVAAAGVVHVWARVARVEASYRQTALMEERRDLLLEQAELRSRVSAQRAPQRLMAAAQRLKLAPPPAERILVLVGGQPTPGDRAVAERR
jgi:hypothetical protein